MKSISSPPVKVFVDPETLQTDSFILASKVFEDGFEPDFMVAIWRGGAQIGCCVHEFFKYLDMKVDHIAIRTSRYTGIDETSAKVEVHNLGYLVERVKSTSKVLLVDDIFDTGSSIAAIIETLKEKLGSNMPTDMRVATVYYKPTRNESDRVPDYFVKETSEWIVFPHELEALTNEEIVLSKGVEVANLVRKAQESRLGKKETKI